LLQVLWLFVLAMPIASVAWTVTHEEIFQEPRNFCLKMSEHCRALLQRKFFYLFTCEYCLSHYVAGLFLWLTHFKLLSDDWRGYVVSLFSLVFVANVYMGFYNRMRVNINVDRTELQVKKRQIEQIDRNGGPNSTDPPIERSR